MSYRGITVPLPVGAQGFTGTLNPSQAGPGHLLYVDGAELDANIIRKEGGATLLTPTPIGGGGVVISGCHWVAAPETNYDIVFMDNGTVLRDDGGGTFPDTLASGLAATRDPPPVFTAGGGETVGGDRKLFMFSSSNQVHVAAGTGTMNPIANPATDWASAFPTFGILHSNRIFAGGNSSDPHRLYYSTLSDHGDFINTGSGTLAIYPGEGEGIVGAFSFRGALVVFKYPKGIYVVNTTDPSPLNWVVQPLTRSTGTLSQHSIIQIENDVLYMDRGGDIHSLSATNEFGDINTSNLGDRNLLAPFMRDNINLASLRRVVGCWYAAKRQAWFAMPRMGGSDNDFRLIISLGATNQEGQRVPRIFMSRRDECVSMWLRPDGTSGIEKPVVGDTTGNIWMLDQDARNKGGDAYQVVFETSNTDFGWADQTLATKAKSGQFLELAFEPRGDWYLDVEVYWDDVLTQVIQFNMGSGGASLDSFTLDVDTLSSNVVKSKRARLEGSGRRLRLICKNTGLNQDVLISEFWVSFMVNDERDGS